MKAKKLTRLINRQLSESLKPLKLVFTSDTSGYLRCPSSYHALGYQTLFHNEKRRRYFKNVLINKNRVNFDIAVGDKNSPEVKKALDDIMNYRW
jgi:hypothetical protein